MDYVYGDPRDHKNKMIHQLKTSIIHSHMIFVLEGDDEFHDYDELLMPSSFPKNHNQIDNNFLEYWWMFLLRSR